MDAVANHIQCNYKGGPKIAKAIRDMLLPTIVTPNYPTPVTGMVIDKGVKYIWQQEVLEALTRIALLDENKKQAYALMFLGSACLSSSSRSKVWAHMSG